MISLKIMWVRAVVGWEVHEDESADHASVLIRKACLAEGIRQQGLVLHSDNGGPMKGATMLATLQKLGVVPSFSRPSVSDDTPAHGLRPASMHCLLGLLAATGLRVSEALHLQRVDVDLEQGLLCVRQTKFRKSRYVPDSSRPMRCSPSWIACDYV